MTSARRRCLSILRQATLSLGLAGGLAAVPALAQVPFFSTIAGAGNALDTTGTLVQFRGPVLMALSPDRRRIAVADANNQRIRVIDIATRRSSTVAGFGYSTNTPQGGPANEAILNFPYGVAWGSDTVIYAIDQAQGGNSFQRGGLYRISLTRRQVDFIAGLGSSDTGGTGAQTRITRGYGIICRPGMAGAADTLYISAANLGIAQVIVGFTRETTQIRRIIGTGTGAGVVNSPAGLTLFRDSILVADRDNNRILMVGRHAPHGVRFVRAGFQRPIHAAPLGDTALVLTSDHASNIVRRLTLSTGRLTNIFTGIGLSYGVVANDTAIFISQMMLDRIMYTRRDTMALRAYVGQQSTLRDGPGRIASFNTPLDVAFDSAGTRVFVADRDNSAIRAINVFTGEVSTVVANNPRLQYPSDLVVRGRFIYVIEALRNSVFRVSQVDQITGQISHLAGGGGTTLPAGSTVDGDSATSRLAHPSGIAINQSGTFLYIASSGANNEASHSIRRINIATKTTQTIAGALPPSRGFADTTGLNARFNEPEDLVIMGDTILFIADRANRRIRRMDLRTNRVTTIAGTGGGNLASGNDNRIGLQARVVAPGKLSLDTAGGYLYFTDGALLRRMNLTFPNAVETVGGSSVGFQDGLGRSARFRGLAGMAFSPDGRVAYLAENGNGVVRRVTFIINTAPSFTAGPNVNSFENAGPQTFPNWATAISPGSQSEESTQPVQFEIRGVSNAIMFSAQPRITPEGTLTYTSAPHRFGTSTVRIRLRDDGGTGMGGVDSTATISFTITIDSVNSQPVFVLSGTNRTVTVMGNGQPLVRLNYMTGLAASPSPNLETWQQLSFSRVVSQNPGFYSLVPELSVTGSGPSFTATMRLTALPTTVDLVDTVQFTLRDNGGTANNGIDTATGFFVVNIMGVTSARGLMGAEPLTVYPNPAKDGVIRMMGLPNQPCQARLTNLTGVTVRRGVVSASSPAMSVEGLPAGTYMLEVLTERGRGVARVSVR